MKNVKFIQGVALNENPHFNELVSGKNYLPFHNSISATSLGQLFKNLNPEILIYPDCNSEKDAMDFFSKVYKMEAKLEKIKEKYAVLIFFQSVDMLRILQTIRTTLHEKYGIQLEKEYRMLPEHALEPVSLAKKILTFQGIENQNFTSHESVKVLFKEGLLHADPSEELHLLLRNLYNLKNAFYAAEQGDIKNAESIIEDEIEWDGLSSWIKKLRDAHNLIFHYTDEFIFSGNIHFKWLWKFCDYIESLDQKEKS